MDAKRKKDMGSEEKPQETRISPFPDEVLERVLSFVSSNKDRSAVSLVCKDWYTAERWSRTRVFIGNCYSVSPEIVARRFPNIRSFTIKGKPRFSDFNLVPQNWGADIHPWLVVFAAAYPFLEELRLKRMTVSDESLDFLAHTFPGFKALSLVSCDGFSTNGLATIASCCRNLTELDIQESVIDDLGGSWLNYFPESFTENAKYGTSKTLQSMHLSFLNLSYAPLQSMELAKLLPHCPLLRRLWCIRRDWTLHKRASTGSVLELMFIRLIYLLDPLLVF